MGERINCLFYILIDRTLNKNLLNQEYELTFILIKNTPNMNNRIRKTISAAALVGFSSAAFAQGVISTIAGSGTSGTSSDGIPAVAASLGGPQGVAVDGSGNVFIAETYSQRVRKVDPATGLISTYAGGGSATAMGITATMASMHQPRHLFINAAGDLLITDHFYDMTFQVDHSSGLIYSRLGCHSQGCGGDGGDPTLAKMMLPDGSCEDAAGNTYLADRGCGKIRKVDATTGLTSTFATMSGVSALFVDPSSPNDLYVALSSNHKIVKIDIATGAVTNVAGTGSIGNTGNGLVATAATMGNPTAIYIDNNHTLYFCDATYHVVRMIDLPTGIIHTIAGTGTAGFSGDGGQSPFAQLNNPQGIWVDNSGYVYIADAGNNRIRKITPKGLKPNGTAMAVNEVAVYPNPTTGSFTLATSEDLSNTQVTVFNVVGAKVYSAALSGNNNVIDLSGQAAGLYTVTFSTASGTHTLKVTLN